MKRIGYNAKDGQFYVDSEWVDELTLSVINYREVEVFVNGELDTLLQILVVYNGEHYEFDTRSYIARKSLFDNYNGLYSGILVDLHKHINRMNTKPQDYELVIKAGDVEVIGKGHRAMHVYPIIISKDFKYIGGQEEFNNDWEDMFA